MVLISAAFFASTAKELHSSPKVVYYWTRGAYLVAFYNLLEPIFTASSTSSHYAFVDGC